MARTPREHSASGRQARRGAPGLPSGSGGDENTATDASQRPRDARLGKTIAREYRIAADGLEQMKDERPGLLPALGVFTTMMVVIGGVIGSGVFRKSGVMASEVGS